MHERHRRFVSGAQRASAEPADRLAGRDPGGLASYREANPGAAVAPYAVNQIIHQSNDRLEQDLAVCASHRVPLIITSLRAPGDRVKGIHDWGGKVFHDVTTIRHAERRWKRAWTG